MDNFAADQSSTGRNRLPAGAEGSFLAIGRIVRPHGVRGEARVELYTDLPERFGWLDEIYVGEEAPQPLAVESVRFHQGVVLLKLGGIDDRDAIERLRGQLLQVPESEAIPLAEGEYFLFQLVGLSVYSDSGELLGQLTEVLETGANNVFVVVGDRGEILLPDTDEVVREVDFSSGRITISLIPGLLD